MKLVLAFVSVFVSVGIAQRGTKIYVNVLTHWQPLSRVVGASKCVKLPRFVCTKAASSKRQQQRQRQLLNGARVGSE